MELETMDEPLKPLPRNWVEAIYKKFSIYWGDQFASKWKGLPMDDLLDAWAEELAGYEPDELRRGLDKCREKTFPVSLPEFMQLCRPSVSPSEAFYEAQKQSGRRGAGEDTWSHPAVFWAYYELAWEFRNLPTHEVEKRFIGVFTRIMNSGSWSPIPKQNPNQIGYQPQKPEVEETREQGKERFENLMREWGLRDETKTNAGT